MVWQALKYTAYVSSLPKMQIVDIYQQYLERYAGGGNASAQICEFMEVEELEETILNSGNDQRMVFIAANFRREVTTTVLWLIRRGVRAQCFKITPYSFSDELMVDIRQIIPTPEAADFMIGMSSKETDEKAVQDTRMRLHAFRKDFWIQALERLQAYGIGLYRNVGSDKDHWLSARSGVSACPYQMIFLRNEVRVELSLQRRDSAENKWFFDALLSQQDEIEAVFGDGLIWRRMDDKKASRVVFSQPFDAFDRETWPEMTDWLSKHIAKLEAAFSNPLAQLNRGLRSQGEEAPE